VVQRGSSGGPLLDQGGRVLGITDKATGVLLPVSAGLNFFTPIGDVLDALSLRPQ
jgi:S1-C subfamily serine protease